jgi:hypothetical protein
MLELAEEIGVGEGLLRAAQEGFSGKQRGGAVRREPRVWIVH